jgi:hypothetical protein
MEAEMIRDLEAAQIRIEHAMKRLEKVNEDGHTLADYAEMAVAADELRSAINLIYDGLWEANQATGIIGRDSRYLRLAIKAT